MLRKSICIINIEISLYIFALPSYIDIFYVINFYKPDKSRRISSKVVYISSCFLVLSSDVNEIRHRRQLLQEIQAEETFSDVGLRGCISLICIRFVRTRWIYSYPNARLLFFTLNSLDVSDPTNFRL